jgi:HAD superfamily hydrolase (TIGR01509 family)
VTTHGSPEGPPEGLVFDFDGVICDTEHPEFESTRVAFAEQGVVLTDEVWAAAIGRSWEDAWRTIHDAHGHEVDMDLARLRRRAVHPELIDRQGPMEGVVELLDAAAAAGLPIAVASNSDQDWVDRNLRRLGLRDRFRSLHTIDTVERGKPFPDPYLAACAALGVAPERAVAFEDSHTGVSSAAAAGMRVVAVPHALTATHDVSSAHLVVSSLARVGLADLRVLFAT